MLELLTLMIVVSPSSMFTNKSVVVALWRCRQVKYDLTQIFTCHMCITQSRAKKALYDRRRIFSFLCAYIGANAILQLNYSASSFLSPSIALKNALFRFCAYSITLLTTLTPIYS